MAASTSARAGAQRFGVRRLAAAFARAQVGSAEASFRAKQSGSKLPHSTAPAAQLKADNVLSSLSR